MKQMGPWDLTCRPPETHVLPRSSAANQPQVVGVSRSPQTVTFGRRHLNYRQNHPITNSDGPTQLQLVMRQAQISALPNQNFFWNSVTSNKQLQALLATATRAASLNSNHRIDLAPPLNWLQAPTKLDLTRQPAPLRSPVVDFNGTTFADNKHHPMTIISSQRDSCNYNEHGAITAAVAVSVTHNAHQGCAPLSLSSSPVSSTSSSRSSTESINLTLAEAKSKSKFTKVIDSEVPSSFRHLKRSLEGAVSSPSCISSDAEFLYGGGEVSNASDGYMDSRIDRRARKKDQNRRAAYNYRRKKMEERDRMLEEEARLVHKHVRLAGQIAKLEKKILVILNTRTARVLNKDGKLVYYSCPICLKHSFEDIETLRNHIKAQHLQQYTPSGSREATGSRSNPYASSTLARSQIELRELERYEDLEYDSCIESDETNNFGNTDLYNDCDDKFVNRANLDGDDYNIKNNFSS